MLSTVKFNSIIGFCFILLTHKGHVTQGGLLQDFQPNLASSSVVRCQGLFRPRVPGCTAPACTANLLTLYQHRASNQYKVRILRFSQLLKGKQQYSRQHLNGSIPTRFSVSLPLLDFSNFIRTGISKLISHCALLHINFNGF